MYAATGLATSGTLSPSSCRRSSGVLIASLHRALEVGDQVLRVHPRHHLDQLPAVGAEVVEDLLGRVHQHGRGQVFPLGHARHPRAPTRLATMPPDLPDATVRYAGHEDAVVDLHLPRGSRPANPETPLVVLLHGGFWKQEWDRRHTRTQA